MKKVSSTQGIVINVVTYVKLKKKQGIIPTQRSVTQYLKSIYQQNPFLFGNASWKSVSGTFRSMISKAKNNTNSNSGLERFIRVVDVGGLNVLNSR
jgi:hypothetical protein